MGQRQSQTRPDPQRKKPKESKPTPPSKFRSKPIQKPIHVSRVGDGQQRKVFKGGGYAELSAFVLERFQVTSDFSLRYIDAEGDPVILETDFDLRWACAQSNQDALHLQLLVPDRSSPERRGTEKNPAFSLQVKTITGRLLTLVCEPSSTVGDLKSLIEEQRGPPPVQQQLIFDSRKLEDSSRVADYDIPDRGLLYMTLRL